MERIAEGEGRGDSREKDGGGTGDKGAGREGTAFGGAHVSFDEVGGEEFAPRRSFFVYEWNSSLFSGSSQSRSKN